MLQRRINLIFGMVAAALTAATFGSCIENDVPPADIKGNFLTFEVEGEARTAVINTLNRTVDVTLLETADPKNVLLTNVTVVEGGTCEIGTGSVVDLSSPLKVIIKTYAEYEWTVTATQTIDRRFVIEDQVGNAYFEEHTHSAFAYVTKGTDLTRINVVELKLGPQGITTTDPMLDGTTVSFRATGSGDETMVREVKVRYRDVEETWSLYVTEGETRLSNIDLFARRAYITGEGQEGLDNGFHYRLADGYDPSDEGDEDNTGWNRIPESMMSYDGGVFKAALTGLEPETEYVARAFSGEDFSADVYFTTEGTRELPDGSFDNWYFGERIDVSGKVTTGWNPWAENGEKWWDTGNPGATTLGESNSVPTEYGEGCPLNPSGRAAYLRTKFVGVGFAGKIAGGNIYFGNYNYTSGYNGLVDIGQPWRHKPTKLKGYYKFFPQSIDFVGKIHEDLGLEDHFRGSTDSMFVSIALWASPDGRTIPFTENTTPANFAALTRDTDGVIAYGSYASPRQQANWAEFTVEIEYFDTGTLPENTVLYISCTSSKYANYFTAAEGSLLYLDELSLVYD